MLSIAMQAGTQMVFRHERKKTVSMLLKKNFAKYALLAFFMSIITSIISLAVVRMVGLPAILKDGYLLVGKHGSMEWVHVGSDALTNERHKEVVSMARSGYSVLSGGMIFFLLMLPVSFLVWVALIAFSDRFLYLSPEAFHNHSHK